ncbi:hypothetical protein AVV48_gp20 [Acinetobacter phage phiAC-1]|uniref:hypothetical protein n=1 Tax=Acinetobacter phage phiAC-1 TaxID=1229760 RepID=UPI00028AEBE7|nr:hypothetical protein AVV48_gp20 [Acinetobacter phage phiAC-1]AFU62269.1 hypothetical protein phiAC-1_0020 [Acinetobacter phage phiAC-1]
MVMSNAEYLKDKYPDFDIYKYVDEFDGSTEYWSILNGEGIKFDWNLMGWVKSCLTAFWVTDTCVKVL